jgi:hypothetical protein
MLKKSKLDAHAIEEGQGIDWDQTVQIEPNNIYRKYKEATYML